MKLSTLLQVVHLPFQPLQPSILFLQQLQDLIQLSSIGVNGAAIVATGIGGVATGTAIGIRYDDRPGSCLSFVQLGKFGGTSFLRGLCSFPLPHGIKAALLSAKKASGTPLSGSTATSNNTVFPSLLQGPAFLADPILWVVRLGIFLLKEEPFGEFILDRLHRHVSGRHRTIPELEQTLPEPKRTLPDATGPLPFGNSTHQSIGPLFFILDHLLNCLKCRVDLLSRREAPAPGTGGWRNATGLWRAGGGVCGKLIHDGDLVIFNIGPVYWVG